MLIALSYRIEIIERLTSKFIALGPCAYAYLSRSRLAKSVSNSNVISLLESVNVKEVLKNTWFVSALEGYICRIFENICKAILEEIAEDDAELNNLERLPIILGHYPAGTSVRVLKHWA
jgi:hypothetical protein